MNLTEQLKVAIDVEVLETLQRRFRMASEANGFESANNLIRWSLGLPIVAESPRSRLTLSRCKICDKAVFASGLKMHQIRMHPYEEYNR